MHAVVPGRFIACVYAVGVEQTRGPGRPRIWSDNTERARAYRQRKAAEQASPDALRRERRELRQRVTQLSDALERADRAREKAELRADRLSIQVTELSNERDRLKAELDHVPRYVRRPGATQAQVPG
jgi:chromosome segregation ATPase